MAITTNGAAGSALTISADLAATISDESGTGAVVFNVLPTFGTTGVKLSGSTSGTTTVVSGATAGASVLTLPVATDTLVGKATTDTFTNKTLTSPVLGGTTTTASGNLAVLPATYILEVQGGASTEGMIQLNCAVNSHGQKIRSQPHAQAASNTLLLPGGTTIGNADAVLVSNTGTQTLTNKTLTSPTLTTPALGVATATSINGTTIPSSSTLVTSVTSANTTRISIGGTASAPTVDLVTTAVTAGTYTSTTLTVDAYGRITSASNGSGGGVSAARVYYMANR